MDKKYKITEETIYIGKQKLYRIEALKDFYGVKKGDKGGFVEHEGNLSQLGCCWVYNNAVVRGDAWVGGNAEIFGDAIVEDNAIVNDYSHVSGFSRVSGEATLNDHADIFGHAKVYENANVYNHSKVYDNAQICGNASICGNTKINGNAIIKSNSDYIVFKNWWSSGRFFTWTRSNNMWSVGCFYGTGEELIAKAYKDSELSGREYERVVNYVNSILKDMEG